jgi:hypothetical protein
MTGWYSSSWKARSLEYGEGGGFPPPFSYATKQSGGDKTHRPPDTAARLRPTKQPVCFTTERAVCDTIFALFRQIAHSFLEKRSNMYDRIIITHWSA